MGRALSIVIPEGDAAYLRRLSNSRERHVRYVTLTAIGETIVEDFCPDGERHFYGFLKNAAKPDSKYLA